MNKNHVFSVMLLSLSGFSVFADQEDLFDQAGELASNAAQAITKNVSDFVTNRKTPDLIDPMGQYPVQSEVPLNIVQNATDLAKDISNKAIQVAPTYADIKDGIKAVAHSVVQELNHIADLEASNTLNTKIDHQAWYEKAWNAEIAGYKNAGKYVIVGTTVVATALITAYYLGYFNKTAVSVEKMVDDLIVQAQTNPNIVIVELPKILALCKDKTMKKYVTEYVLKNIIVTPEIKKAFFC